MDKEIHIRDLLYKYISGQCTGLEQDELLAYLQTPAGKWVFDEVMNSEAGKTFASSQETDPIISNRIFNRLQQSIGQAEADEAKTAPFFHKNTFRRIAATFARLLVMFGITYAGRR